MRLMLLHQLRFEGRVPIARNLDRDLAALPRGINLPLPVASMRIYSQARAHGVYAMYGIPTEQEHGQTNDRVFGEIAADPEIAQFDYDGLVLIQNANEFDNRLKAAALRLGFSLNFGLVRYVPPSHCGEMGPFKKLDTYAYQNEVRYLTTRPI